MAEWISVKDALPPNGSDDWYNIVLTKQRSRTKRVVKVGYWDGYHKRFWGFEAPTDYSVTHWMHLPEPPMTDPTCPTCRWYAPFEGVCCNGDSEYQADFTGADDTCPEWEKKDDG